MANYTETFSLNPMPPFDFGHTLSLLERFGADGVPKTLTETGLTQALTVQGQAVGVQLESSGGVEQPQLDVTLIARDLITAELIAKASERLNFYLGLQDDLGPFYALAAKDDAFAPVLEQLYGYHQVKFPSVFTSVCWALVTQRTPNSFAYGTMAHLSELLGDRIWIAGQTFPTFPEPQAFLASDAPAKVLAATNNTRKTERLLPLAREFLGVDEAFLRDAPYEEVYRWLKTLPGLGAWSVDYIMLRGLGRTERTPWTDTWLMDALSKVYAGGLSLSRGDARRLAEGYGWYQGLWIHYLKTALW